MSTDYFLVCRKCRQATPIASDSALSGWKWFCTPDKGPVNFVGMHVEHLDAIGIVREQSKEAEEFERVEPGDSGA